MLQGKKQSGELTSEDEQDNKLMIILLLINCIDKSSTRRTLIQVFPRGAVQDRASPRGQRTLPVLRAG